MKIAKSFLKILLAFTTFLLLVSFVRIVVTGDTSFYMSFSYLLDSASDVSYNPGSLLDAFNNGIKSLTTAFGRFRYIHDGFWSGDNVFDKILSIFSTLRDYIVSFGRVFIDAGVALFNVLTEFGRLLAVILEFIVKLLGAGWTN